MRNRKRSRPPSTATTEATKTLDDYAQAMRAAFQEMFRVLKPGRWATVEFNNSDGAVFEAIKERSASRLDSRLSTCCCSTKQQKTFKQVKGAEGVEDVVDKDVLFNLHKPALVHAEVRAEDHDLEQQLADAVRQHLQTLPERIKADPAKYNDEHRTTATINSMLMNTLIPKGVNVDRLNLPFIERVCSRYFRKVGQRWYLRGEAVGSEGTSSRLIEEEVAIKDEISAIEWIRQHVKEGASLDRRVEAPVDAGDRPSYPPKSHNPWCWKICSWRTSGATPTRTAGVSRQTKSASG